MPDFKNQYGPWAIVAGASEGLGAAFAEALAKRGLNIILIARRSEKLEILSEQLRKNYSVEINCLVLDLADLTQTRELVSQLDQNIGLLIYNAAYAPIGYFENIPEDNLEKIIDVNIKAPLLLTRLLVPKMIENRRGGIILMSSLAGAQGSPKIATYAASKAFSAILAEGLWYELKDKGIDILATRAGAISTPGYKNAQNSKDAPGTLDAGKVAESSLNSLGKGPGVIPGFTNKMAHFFMSRLFSRRFAVSIMGKNTKDLS